MPAASNVLEHTIGSEVALGRRVLTGTDISVSEVVQNVAN